MSHHLFTALRWRWRKRFGVVPLRQSLARVNEWFHSPLGQLILSREQRLIDEQLINLFGYHLLQLSVTHHQDLTSSSRISHRFVLHPRWEPGAFVHGVADFNHLPLPSNSIDVVILHHVLDYSQNPHHILREASAALISHGHLLVVGFNPWSLLGVWRWVARFLSDAPQWRHQALRLGRVLDWLAVLDCEPLVIEQGFFVPPYCNPGVMKHLQWLERWGKRLGLPWGGFYLIVARKDSLMPTPVKPHWQSYMPMRGLGVVKILGRASRGHSAVCPFQVDEVKGEC